MSVEVVAVQKGFENVESYMREDEPFSKINNAFKAITGGKSLAKLMEDGLVYNMHGEPLSVAGIKEDVGTMIGIDVKKVCDVMKKDGIMILDENAGNRPRHVYFDLKKSDQGTIESMDLYTSSPISKKDLPGYLNTIAASAEINLQHEEPAKPGFFNQLLDGIKRLFGGSGTDEMIQYRNQMSSYRAELVQLDKAKENARKIRDGAKTFETHVKNAPDLKQGLNNWDMLNKAVDTDKLGYEANSKEWNDDFIIHDTFQHGVKEVAQSDADVMKLIVNMGANGSIKNLYDAYKKTFWEGSLDEKKQELQQMIKDAVANAASQDKEAEKAPVKTTEAAAKSESAPKIPG